MAVAAYALYVVTIRGSRDLDLRLPGNPVVKHQGSRGVTLATLMLDEHLLKSLSELADGFPDVKVELRRMDEQTKAQQEERDILMGVGQEDRVWLSSSCPSCFWLDPLTPSGCGARDWGDDSKKAALQMQVAADNLASCPVIVDSDV